MSEETDPFGPISETLRRAAATLREAGVPFLLGGSLAFWARGGKETANDLDLMVKAQDAEAALSALEAAGMRPERPPEDWLYKARDGEVPVDLIFAPSGIEITDAVMERGEQIEVAAVRMDVMALEDALVTKLSALGEHSLDYEPLLQTARSLREKVDWPSVPSRVEGNPYAEAVLFLLERLEIVGPAGTGSAVEVRALEPPEASEPALGPPPGVPR